MLWSADGDDRLRNQTPAPTTIATMHTARAAPLSGAARLARFGVGGVGAASSSSISACASPMSRRRRFGSFSRHRCSSRRMRCGVASGSAFQSGSRSRMAAIVSETVSPAKASAAGQHLVEHAAERPDVGALVDRLAARLLGLM